MKLFIHGGDPKSSIYSIFIGCNILNHPFWAISIYENLHAGQTIRDSYDTWIHFFEIKQNAEDDGTISFDSHSG